MRKHSWERIICRWALRLTPLFFEILFAGRIPITQWIDPVGGRPITPEEYNRKFAPPQYPLKLGNLFQPKSTLNLVDIIVETSLWQSAGDKLYRWFSDLEFDGYSVIVDTFTSGEPAEIRNHLATLRPALVGAIFVGNLPVAWFRMVEVWNPGDTTISIFPCDYYFCDLDGDWQDIVGDGTLDRHTGATEPEIWLARIDPNRLSFGQPARLLSEYLERNHDYRAGIMPVSATALSYEYRDWHDYFYYPFSEFESAVIERDTIAFSASGYLGYTRCTAFELVSIMAHSSPWRHYMGDYGGLVFGSEFPPLPPLGNFYQLFACSGARFVEIDNLAQEYLFAGPRSLWVVGSTKTGSIIPAALPMFFSELRNHCVGDVLKGIMDEFAEIYPDWMYGMVILGDPTLRIIYESRGTIDISLPGPGDGNLLVETPAISPRFMITSGDTLLCALSGSNQWDDFISVPFRGNTFALSELIFNYNLTARANELNILRYPPNLVVDGGADGVKIGTLESLGSPYVFGIGEGYHSHVCVGKCGTGPMVAFNWFQPSPGNPVPSLWVVIRFLGWTPPGGLYYLIQQGNEALFPTIVSDSSFPSGNIWLFWTQNTYDGSAIYYSFGQYNDGFPPQYLWSMPVGFAYGSSPSAVVDRNGDLWVAWRSNEGAICANKYESATNSWLGQRVLWASGMAHSPNLALGKDGFPLLAFSAVDSTGNSDIWMTRANVDGWSFATRLTTAQTPDYDPDFVELPDGRVLVAWTQANYSRMYIRWGIYDIVGMDENIPNVKPACEIRVSPNPASGAITIFSQGSSEDVILLDISGKVIAREKIVDGIARIDPNKPGIYFVKLKNKNTKPVKVTFLP